RAKRRAGRETSNSECRSTCKFSHCKLQISPVGSLPSELRPIVAELAGAPRVYVDANVPLGVVGFMRHVLHWDVLFVLEDPQLRRASDREHFRLARELARTLITLDHDFFDARRFPLAESPGVVVCTAPDEAALK